MINNMIVICFMLVLIIIITTNTNNINVDGKKTNFGMLQKKEKSCVIVKSEINSKCEPLFCGNNILHLI